MSFTYYGHPIKLHIANASLLSGGSIGAGNYGDSIAYAFDSFSEYFSQLQHLHLVICLYAELDLGIGHPPALRNLKHLELSVSANSDQSLLGWTPLIVAAPSLQKLTLKWNGGGDYRYARPILKRKGCPLKCLKTLELVGFRGRPLDLELATYVLENAIMLKEVIIDFTPMYQKKPFYEGGRERLVELEMKLPQSVKLIVK